MIVILFAKAKIFVCYKVLVHILRADLTDGGHDSRD